MNNANRELVQQINQGDETAFKELFFMHYSELNALAEQITGSSEQARDAVQDVFFKIWKSHSEFDISISLKAYLYRAVRNQVLNVREKQKSQERIKKEFAEEIIDSFEEHQNGSQNGKPKIVTEIWKIVELMPNRRRTAFTLHHRHGLTYKEISAVMEVSLKTVETHIGLALKEIRKQLHFQIDA
jgi:RNA polymerase sigma-70 factor (ECF subfamily)